MNIENIDGINFLNKMHNNSIDLILTDPPYIISKETGMNKLKKKISKMTSNKKMKTEEDWQKFKQEKGYITDKLKDNYLKYGNTAGKKFGYSTEYGEWDKKFTIKQLEKFDYMGKIVMIFSFTFAFVGSAITTSSLEFLFMFLVVVVLAVNLVLL